MTIVHMFFKESVGIYFLQKDLAVVVSQIREQMSGPDLHVFTLKFLALRKNCFSPIKNNFQHFFDFCLPLFYATFQCGP
jgi:hypothetical protein